MIPGTQEIFFDESGFTGNNLLHPDQPFFTYASIAISTEDATECVKELIKDFGIQGGELKGANLVKFNKGRKAVNTVLSRYHDRIKVTVNDKKYALACKFFEYIFEPAIADVNAIFYGIGFHKFISNILHIHFQARSEYAEELFVQYQAFMRSYDDAAATHLFSNQKLPNMSPVLDSIKSFSVLNRNSVVEELEHLRDSDIGKWILDITDTSLHTLLSHWGEQYEQLDVYCDSSKPLQEVPDLFDCMVGCTDRKYVEMNGKRRLLTYNLKERIKFANSKECPGIQLADVAAAAFGYMFYHPSEDCSQGWAEYLTCVHDDSVLPDYDVVDLKKLEVIRNAVVLEELCARSREGRSLTENIDEFLRHVEYRLRYDPPRF